MLRMEQETEKQLTGTDTCNVPSARLIPVFNPCICSLPTMRESLIPMLQRRRPRLRDISAFPKVTQGLSAGVWI